jgi:RNA polymerase sigma-70 factor (ECF subfamily)
MQCLIDVDRTFDGTFSVPAAHFSGECGQMRRPTAVVTMQQELVRQAIDGDREAFSELMRTSAPRQYAVATLILRDRSRAQDAVQDAFVSAWKGLSALRKPDAWDAWLHRLTVRACFASVRREKRRRLVELHVMPDLEPAGADDSLATMVQRDQLERELGQLPIEQRAVIVLRFFADLPLDEVADILDIPIGTAKSRQHRGLEAMRASMSAEPEIGRAQAMERVS